MPRKLIGLVLVGLSLALATPVSAGGFHGGSHGGFHGGSHGRFHHGFHRSGCCFGPAFAGGVFLGAALAAPYYAYPYYAYPYPYVVEVPATYESAPAYQAPAYAPPPVQREVCYVGGCYHLQGNGVTTAYQWVWVPSVPAPPPGPPTR